MSTEAPPQAERGDASERRLEGVVYVVDDDNEAREYVAFMLRPLRVQVSCHSDPQEFLDTYTDRGAACLVTDVFMPGMTGIELQRELARRGAAIPTIVMSGQAEVPSVVEAVRNGALDFLEKPFDAQTLRDRVSAGLELCGEWRRHRAARLRAQRRLARLTPRQRAVLDGLIAGKPSKIIAGELGVSARTVDVHRFRLMRTLAVETLPDLFRLLAIAGDGAVPELKAAPAPAARST